MTGVQPRLDQPTSHTGTSVRLSASSAKQNLQLMSCLVYCIFQGQAFKVNFSYMTLKPLPHLLTFPNSI